MERLRRRSCILWPSFRHHDPVEGASNNPGKQVTDVLHARSKISRSTSPTSLPIESDSSISCSFLASSIIRWIRSKRSRGCRYDQEVAVVETHLDLRGLERLAVVFYPGAELNNDPTNWWGPNRQCMEALFIWVRADCIPAPSYRQGSAPNLPCLQETLTGPRDDRLLCSWLLGGGVGEWPTTSVKRIRAEHPHRGRLCRALRP